MSHMNEDSEKQTVYSFKSIAPRAREESDSLGSVVIPAGALWGAHTQRALQNFPISGYPISKHPSFIVAYLKVKLACAEANHAAGELDDEQLEAVEWAAKNLIEAIVDGASAQTGWSADMVLQQFPVDVYQGGAGTSTNMNVNEVLANLADFHMGRPLGLHDEVMHPNDVVNRSQSTNDTYPTAAKLALLEEARRTVLAAYDLKDSLVKWGENHAHETKLGRTQLQDAVPMSYKQEADAWAYHVNCAAADLQEDCFPTLRLVTLGGTAIGTGVLGGADFGRQAVKRLSAATREDLGSNLDLVSGTTDLRAFLKLSGALRQLALALKKLADDLRLLASGPRAGLHDYELPAVQAGSSIMPGKVNPVIPEMMCQVAFRVIGADATVQAAASASQLQLCAFEPIMLHELLRSMELLQTAMKTMTDKCVNGMETTGDGTQHAVDAISDVTGLVEVLGYDKCADLAHKAEETGESLRAVIADDPALSARPDLDALLDAVSPWALIGEVGDAWAVIDHRR